MTKTNITYKPLEVQAGKRYNRRDGKVSGVLVKCTASYWHVFSDGRFDYSKNGGVYSEGQVSPMDLISEYTEPTVEERVAQDAAMLGTGFYKRMPDGTTEYLRPEDVVMMKSNDSTAEPQDEWGPWIGWNGGECPVDVGVIVQVQEYNENRSQAESSQWLKAGQNAWHHLVDNGDNIIAYRVKKYKPKPEVLTDKVWVSLSTGAVYTSADEEYRNDKQAIITLTDGKLSIDWVDEA